MGQKLQQIFLNFFLSVSILLAWGGVSLASAQISLEDDSPLEVNFSLNSSQRQESSITLGLTEIESIFSPEFSLQENGWQPYHTQQNVTSNYYISEGNSPTAAGRIQIQDTPYQTYFLSSIQNNSAYSVSNLIVAYDFVYNFYDRSANPAIELMFRVNDGEWKSVKNGVIERGSLRSQEDVWSSFSLHLNLDEIYLRKSDTIHLMWVLEGSESVSDPIPLGLQRIGIYPEKVDQNLLKRGDLIITEILPSTKVNGADFEYVEVFNPGEVPVSLKGVELMSPLGAIVIQKDIFVEPYDYTIISNADISSFETVGNSYFYSGSIIEKTGSRIELEREGQLIASATYEVAEAGVALELNRASNAYDGYSSLQDFKPSQVSYFQDLYGSPGVSGSTLPMYIKEFEDSGFYILSIPGNLIQKLNRSPSLDFYSLNGDLLDIDSVNPNQPVLVHKSNNEPLKIFVENNIQQVTNLEISSRLTSYSRFISLPIQSDREMIQRYKNVKNTSHSIPITQVWNQQRSKFRLQVGGLQTDQWTPFVVNRSVSELIENPENRLTTPLLDRILQFALVPEDENNSTYSDVVMVGFLDTPSQYSELRYDLPKLDLTLPALMDGKRQSLMYLTSTLSNENYNSFTHLPYEIDKEYEVGLGLYMADEAGSATLTWKLENKIPDEWVITVEDTYNGTVINLNEENEYRFRYNSSAGFENETENVNPQISTISPNDRPRFIVKIQPYESYANQTLESETPSEIELRPNYPNPFNPSTNINFFLPEERSVRVGIYNIVGQQVALLLDDTVQQGEHSLVWDASDKPSGIYIVQLESGNRIFTRKITLIK